MNTIYNCVDSFVSLIDTEYIIKIGRKETSVTLHIQFQKDHCFHLMGLQHLKDRPNLKRSRSKVFDDILKRKISKENIESSVFYSGIARRIQLLPTLESILDSNDTIFKYNRNLNQFSMIEADYLLKSNLTEETVFVFLSQEKDGTYCCKSFFPKETTDFSLNQPVWTLLYKEKIQRSSGKRTVLYDKQNSNPCVIT